MREGRRDPIKIRLTFQGIDGVRYGYDFEQTLVGCRKELFYESFIFLSGLHVPFTSNFSRLGGTKYFIENGDE
jgi:hypothetical protein